MAAQGTALVPTLGAFAASAFQVCAGDPGPRRDSYLAGWAAMPPTARAAYEAGVTVLAGTDTHPCGTVPQEVERLISAGLPRAAAVGAASWTARSWLGLPGLTDGAPADLVVYDEDPVAHPAVLYHPRRIILRGQSWPNPRPPSSRRPGNTSSHAAQKYVRPPREVPRGDGR
jgi:imidazolonepropionase-like amidohydrolase